LNDLLARSTAAVRAWLGPRRPVAAIVLGSGLGQVAASLTRPTRLGYRELPGFPEPGVEGHVGELLAGDLGGREVLCQRGRVHGYEGHAPASIALPTRIFAALGIRVLIVTNAAGGIRQTLRPGGLMLIADHLNVSFRNALIGGVLSGETRFPDMCDPWDAELRAAARQEALEAGLTLDEGVYAGVIGPSYETPAEIRMLERLGADAVGMSTVPEVLVGRARGIRCLGFSVITNRAAGLSAGRLTHEEVIAAAGQAGQALARVLTGVVSRLSA